MITTLTGANNFSLQAALQQRLAAFEDALGPERLLGPETSVERISETLSSLPFLSDSKLVILDQPSACKQFLEQHEQLLAGVPETTDVIIIEPKLDKRLAYYKFLKKQTDFQEFLALDGPALARWASQYAAEQGGQLSSGDANYLVQRTGLNQQALGHELDKLVLHNPVVSRQNIDLLTEPLPQSSIFDLLDAAFAGRTQRVLDLYAEQQALKVEPQQLIAMLAWQLHVLVLIASSKGMTPEQVASGAKVSPYVVKKSWAVTQRLSVSKLKQLIRNLADLDARSKKDALDLHAALQHYLLTLGA